MEGRIKGGGGLWFWVAIAAVLALALGVSAYLFFRDARPDTETEGAAFDQMTSYSGPTLSVTLYFSSTDGRNLKAEQRDVPERSERNARVRQVVEELVRGPVSGLTPTFPAGARVKGVFIDGKGTVYVDFSRELQTEYPGGAWTETLTIYSLVDTLTANFPEIAEVQILVEGSRLDTLAGHIDASRPFAPRTALIKE
ncbi:MAG: GerMN domain-containing protein [Nitrospirae bacterium]|nr:GerMN domain-containing protein [Nitrospirota bacterium]MBI5696845.1 GerMN domain-containing protein [Nitrospirota bacterium]